MAFALPVYSYSKIHGMKPEGSGDDRYRRLLPHVRHQAFTVSHNEAFMTTQAVCPFYGKSDDYCDVGCGYISPYDVNRIIRYCSCRYGECLKYQELADRFPAELVELQTIAN